jgi:Tol biopolymer transport system component
MMLRLRKWLGTAGVLALALCVAVAPVSATVLKLSSQTNAHGSVLEFRISPDGQYVVYKADRLGDGSDEIYSVPITGGTPVRLNVTPEPPFQVGQYAISPDSQWVVYIVPQQSGQGFATPAELFRVPIAGGASVKLNGALVASGGVWSFDFSPNSARVIYRADQEADNVYELYSVPLDTSAMPVKLNKPLAMDGDVSTVFRITADSSRVVYIADQDSNDVDELYSVPLAGPASAGVKLNGSLVANGDVGFAPAQSYFSISPNSTRVIYLADQDTDNLLELYSAWIDGSVTAIKISGPQLGVNVGVYPGSFQISPDSSRVIFSSLQSSATNHELHIVPIAGPASAGMRLSDPLRAPTVLYGSFAQDGSLVIYVDSSTAPYPLVIVAAAGPANAGITIANDIRSYQLGATHVVYYDDLFELKSAAITNPSVSSSKLNPTFIGHPAYRISPDNSRVVYLNTLGPGPRFDLYSVPITGTYTNSVTISGPLIPNGSVELNGGFQFTPDGQRVVYRADAETDGKIELYVTDEGNLASNKVYLPLVIR